MIANDAKPRMVLLVSHYVVTTQDVWSLVVFNSGLKGLEDIKMVNAICNDCNIFIPILFYL